MSWTSSGHDANWFEQFVAYESGAGVSSYSGGGNDDACVELARLSDRFGVRDSKKPEGGHLELGRDAFVRLLDGVKRDR
ncbi:DUF397 domain-containing protein [Streptodolium elevatio]|uniref:DUF397 domain-containing protein n=1 Tax=Streptodolium elevatio TaxID=3157996 RepID=A0ABV3DG82_9ACTN